MVRYNLMTCEGFGVDGALSCNSAFVMAWVGIFLLAIIFIFAKKWLGEEEITGMPYNWVGSIIGFFAYFLMETFLGNFKISFLVGLLGGLGGGYLAGLTMGGTGE